MNFIKKAVTTLGGIFLAALLIAALAPKATHGLVAALVQVTNTTANPASTWDADHATRIPYQSYEAFAPVFAGGQTLPVSFAQVPAGYRLVIQNINADLAVVSDNPVPSACIGSNFNPFQTFPCVTGVYTGSQGDFGVINQQVTRYIGPGDTPVLGVLADFSSCSGGPCDSATISGYLENCAVTGCPAPVH